MDFTNNMEKYMCVIDRLVKTGRKQPVRGSCWGCNVADSSQTLDLHTLVTVAVTAASSESHKDFPAKAHSLAEHHHGREAVHPPARPPNTSIFCCTFGPNSKQALQSGSGALLSACLSVFSIMHASFYTLFLKISHSQLSAH